MTENNPNFKRLKVFPQLANRDIICFNLSGDSLKLVHGRAAPSGLRFVDFLSVDIQGRSDEDLPGIIREAVGRLKLGSAEAVNVIPAHFAITKDIEIPSQDPKEIREILDLQAIRHTPYSQEEIIIDYMKVGTRKDSYTKLIFMIVPLSLVRRQIAVLARAGVKIERVFFAPEALGHACSRIFHLEQKSSLQTVIHIDVKFTDFMNVSGGKLVYIRSIPVGAQHLAAEKERYQGRFIEEIRKSVEAYEGEDNDRTSEEYILTGAPGAADSLQEALQQALNKPVRVLPYWEHLPLVSEQLKDHLSSAKESFLDVASALMAIDDLSVNFIPEEIKLRKIFEQKSEDLVKIGISVMVVLALICALLMSRVYFKSAYLKNLNQTYQPDLQKAQKLQKDFSRMEIIKDFSENNDIPIRVLAELYDLVPADVRFTAVKYTDQGKMAIEGNARTMSTVFSFISGLEESRYFKKAESKRTAKRKEGDEELVDFEIVCMLEENFAGKKQ